LVHRVAVAQERKDILGEVILLYHVVLNLVKERLVLGVVVDFDRHVSFQMAIWHVPALQMLQFGPIRFRPPLNYTECNVPNAPHSAASLPPGL